MNFWWVMVKRFLAKAQQDEEKVTQDNGREAGRDKES